jgi:hypothetical protein
VQRKRGRVCKGREEERKGVQTKRGREDGCGTSVQLCTAEFAINKSGGGERRTRKLPSISKVFNLRSKVQVFVFESFLRCIYIYIFAFNFAK